MSGLLPYFVNLRAKVKSGLKDVVFWISAKSDARALREMENALEDADIKRSAFFKDAVITGLPVYNDLPQEGELDFTWCERYAFSDDTGTWLPIAPAQPEPAASDNASISEGYTDESATDNTDSGDTTSAASAGTTTTDNSDSATDTAGSANTAADTSDEVAGSEIATDIAHSCDVNVSGEPMTEVAKGMDWPMKDLPLSVRWMAQKGMDSKVLFLKPAERERLTEIMEADENNNQHLTNIKAITTEETETEPKSLQPEPVTKVADGVFDVSAFFATTSNQGEKTEIPPPNNDDRSQECVEEKATDVPATTESFLHEIVRLQSINNQLLEACIAYQSRAETRQERFLEALFYGITRFAYQWVEGEEDRESEEKLRGDS